MDSSFDNKCINTIRVLSADVVQKANSGHPGAPMGMAPMAYLLWSKYMKYSPENPLWWNRDRFVLSNGHACALLYSMLHLTGYEEFTMDQLKSFRQVGSKTPGHPENHIVKGGVEVSTGPLGQGLTNAVGLAIAEAHLAGVYNKPGFEIFNNKTFVFCGDGCMMEGITSEASSLAGHLGLENLILFYDDNKISIDGDTLLAFTEDVGKRYESYGWRVFEVKDGDHSLQQLRAAIEEAMKPSGKPTLIKVRTTIGFGSAKQGTEKVHGSPLGAEDLAKVKEKFGFDPSKTFDIPEDVLSHFRHAKVRGKEAETQWNQLFEKYAAQYPELAAEITRRFTGKLPDNLLSILPRYKPEDAAKATRQFSQTVINVLGKALPELVGGSADLNPSTLSYLDCSKDFQKESPSGRNIRFGVREHAMAAICNGLAAYGGFISYCSTFLNFIGYAMGAVKVSAVSHLGFLYVMTHDSIGLGEDGPTHQPTNDLMTIRSLPNSLLIRPADGNEVSGAYALAIQERHRPSVLCFSRQAVPNLKGTSVEGVFKGAYVISEPEGGNPQVVLVSSGTEVSLAVEAAHKLSDLRVRVVSFPCFELFQEQSMEYKKSVFPDGVPVLAVEAGSAFGWREFSHGVVGMTTFGASGPAKDVYKALGITSEVVAKRAKDLLSFYNGKPVPSVVERPW